MSEGMRFSGRWVLVTGASSGLGLAMAEQLARDYGAHLILVARRENLLRDLQQKLQDTYSVQCEVIAADLAQPAEVERVFSLSTAHPVYGVILNAGITHFGLHENLDEVGLQQLMAINLTSVVTLVNRFIPYLLQQDQHGGILLISSMAGLLPVPYQSAYAATKAFIAQFGQSLYHELHDRHVSITTFCPGGIKTEMTMNNKLDYFNNSLLVESADVCARKALQAFSHRRYVAVSSWLNLLQLFVARFVPRKWLVALAAHAYRKALR